MSKKLLLELSLLLPGVPDQRDACVARLIELLRVRGLGAAHIIEQNGTAQLCLHFDPRRFNLQQIRSMTLLAGAKLDQRYQHELVRVGGMDCSTCATVIEHALGRLDGVLEAAASYAAETVRLEYDTEKISRKTIVMRLESLGYPVLKAEPETRWYAEYRELIVSMAAATLLLAGWLLTLHGDAPLLSHLVLTGSLLLGGYFAMRDAWQSIRERHLDIDVLMVVAALGAVALGQWVEGALLLTLFSLGHALEHLALDRARHAIDALAALAPKTARVIRDGKELEIPAEELLRGDHMLVLPGQLIAADGKVLTGESSVNQSAITGESMPVDKTIGTEVFAGTVNGEGQFIVEVAKLARDSSLARMIELVTKAQTEKSPTQSFVSRFEKVFVPVVLLSVLGLIVVPPMLGVPFAAAFYRAMAVLVAASPCALAIATPSAVLAGVARAARGGVLIKGGAHLENLGKLATIAFDKTGTITTGKPNVTDVIVLHGDESDLLAITASVESRSGHPLAQALVRAVKERGVVWSAASEVRSLTGKGMQARIGERDILVGNLRLFEHLAVPSNLRQRLAELEAQGKTTVVVMADGVFVGILALADTPRPGVREVITRLKSLGVIHTVMLTGDNEQVALAVSTSVGISDVRAGLLPEEKLAAIDGLLRMSSGVAMIGDGVNDAPAMARATVGIAMGGASTDVALEAADVALMADDLSRLPFAIALSRASNQIIRQNLWAAFGVVALLIPFTLFGWASMGIAVVIHEGATILVVLNALRLLRFKDGPKH